MYPKYRLVRIGGIRFQRRTLTYAQSCCQRGPGRLREPRPGSSSISNHPDGEQRSTVSATFVSYRDGARDQKSSKVRKLCSSVLTPFLTELQNVPQSLYTQLQKQEKQGIKGKCQTRPSALLSGAPLPPVRLCTHTTAGHTPTLLRSDCPGSVPVLWPFS